MRGAQTSARRSASGRRVRHFAGPRRPLFWSDAMTLGYLLGGGVGAVPQGTELYDAFPDVRRTYEEVAGLTGVAVERMLTGELPDELRERRTVGLVREAALALAVHDHLAATGVRPGAIG